MKESEALKEAEFTGSGDKELLSSALRFASKALVTGPFPGEGVFGGGVSPKRRKPHLHARIPLFQLSSSASMGTEPL